MKTTSTPSFWKWTLKSKLKRRGLAFLLIFSLIGRLYLYTTLAGSPCDDGFLCGFWRYLDDINWLEVFVYEFFTTVPIGLVILSFWGLYKRNVLFKPTK